MFYLRLIIVLFVAGTFNVFALVLAHSLPVLSGIHARALALTSGFLLMADAIFLYLICFKFPELFGSSTDFDSYLEQETSGERPSQEEYDRAYERWQADQ